MKYEIEEHKNGMEDRINKNSIRRLEKEYLGEEK